MSLALPRLVGITGSAGAGKDTLADHLVSNHGFTKYALSYPLKRLLNERFGWSEDDWSDREWKEGARFGIHGYNSATGLPFSPRSWAQWLGTDIGRYIGGEDVWVNMMEREWFFLNRHADIAPAMVVPDVRFPNEAQRIFELGGVMLRVTRPDAVAVNPHISEKGLPDQLVSVDVTNDTDIDTFLGTCVDALEECPRGRYRNII